MRCSVLLSLLVLFSPLTAEDVTQVDQLEVDRFASDEEYAEDLPEAQPWGQARVDDDDDVIYLDDDKRIVAEQLIQELDEISSKLDDGDKRTIGASQAITSTDLANVDTLLFNAGLTPRNKPKIRNVGKLSSLDSLFERSDSQSDPISERVPLLVPGMTKKNVEDIKTELKQMLFSTEYADKKVRRQGDRRRPFGRFQNRRPQQRQRPSPFLTAPNPSQFLPATQGSQPAAAAAGRPLLLQQSESNIAQRQPISEFRPQPTDFRLPESPFRQQILGNQRPFNQPSQPIRPSEEEFRPALLGGPTRHPATSSHPPHEPNFRIQTQQSPPPSPQFQPPGSRPPTARPSGPAQSPPPRGNPPDISAADFSALGNFEADNHDPAAAVAQSTNNPDCNLYTEGICLDVRNYPSDIISNYLSRHKPALATMLAEVRSQSADDLVEGISADEENKYSFSHYYGNRRQDENSHAHRDFAQEGGFLCPSDVRYARPQLAQTSRGVWKYIINMGEHTQTIRMERCLKPDSSCSYVSPHYKSHCVQVYNYHRLLSFEESRGMHVDIYKIPVGCNCHVQGYAFSYPPLDGSKATSSILPPATRTNGSNRLQGDNRKSSATSRNENVEPPPFQPDSIRNFKSFLDRQFDGQFTAGGNRRSDNFQTAVRQRKPDLKKKKTNYDYHPIIDFFNDRP